MIPHCYWCPYANCDDCKHQTEIARQTTIHDQLEADE